MSERHRRRLQTQTRSTAYMFAFAETDAVEREATRARKRRRADRAALRRRRPQDDPGREHADAAAQSGRPHGRRPPGRSRSGHLSGRLCLDSRPLLDLLPGRRGSVTTTSASVSLRSPRALVYGRPVRARACTTCAWWRTPYSCVCVCFLKRAVRICVGGLPVGDLPGRDVLSRGRDSSSRDARCMFDEVARLTRSLPSAEFQQG